MKLNASLDRTLEKQNRAYHEASVCVDCKPGVQIKNARWTTLKGLETVDSAGLIQSFDGENVLLLPMTHALVVGSTGTGKSEVFYKNQLRAFSKMPEDVRPSVFITDVKGELYGQIAPMLQDSGYITKVFDMRKPYQTARYNFCSRIFDDYVEARAIQKSLEANTIGTVFGGRRYKSAEHARYAAEARASFLLDRVERAIVELSFIIVDEHDVRERVWPDGARTMLQAIMWSGLRRTEDEHNPMTREKFTIANICRIAYSTGEDCDEITEWLEKASDILCVKSAITSNYKLRAKTTRDGYVSTLNTNLGQYSSRSIGAMTATSDDLEIGEIARSEKPYAIFVITDDRQQTTNNICMIFINSLLNELIDVADHNPTHSLSRDFVILADEFANMPALPAISHKITTLRSRRIWMVMAIQSLPQLEMVYGKEASSIIQDNCDLQVFLGCNNDETKEHFAKSMGRKIGVTTSFGIHNDGSVSVTKSTADVPVIRKSDLDELTLGEFYSRSRLCGNFKSYIVPYFMQECSRVVEQYEPDFRSYNPDDHKYDIYEIIAEENRRNGSSRKFNFDF